MAEHARNLFEALNELPKRCLALVSGDICSCSCAGNHFRGEIRSCKGVLPQFRMTMGNARQHLRTLSRFLSDVVLQEEILRVKLPLAAVQEAILGVIFALARVQELS